MNDDHVLWELIGFSKTLESIIDLISRFNFLSSEHLGFILKPIKVELIINNNKIKDRRKNKMEKKGNKFRDKRTPKKKVKVEMNNPDAVNPELEARKNLTDKEFLEEMLEMIKVRKKQVLENIKTLRDKVSIQAQIKQNLDMLKIFNIDFERTQSLYQKEIKREEMEHGKKTK